MLNPVNTLQFTVASNGLTMQDAKGKEYIVTLDKSTEDLWVITQVETREVVASVKCVDSLEALGELQSKVAAILAKM